MSYPERKEKTMTIPNFQDGVLPVGDYEATFDELRSCVLVSGCGELKQNWDKDWRSKLVDNLEVMVRQLWEVGIVNIFIDGSFVEDKDHPNDIDGYFECGFDEFVSGKLQTALNLLDEDKIWTWDPHTRKPYPGYDKKQLPMWHKYRVEFYPHAEGIMSGIKDKHGNELDFPAAFRLSRSNDKPKGIIKIIKDRSQK